VVEEALPDVGSAIRMEGNFRTPAQVGAAQDEPAPGFIFKPGTVVV
jgi:hypothetical protein